MTGRCGTLTSVVFLEAYYPFFEGRAIKKALFSVRWATIVPGEASLNGQVESTLPERAGVAGRHGRG